jgi:hypothetical protein
MRAFRCLVQLNHQPPLAGASTSVLLAKSTNADALLQRLSPRLQESVNIRIESMSVTGFRPIVTLSCDSAVFDRRKRRKSAGLTGIICLTKSSLRLPLHLN